MAIKSITHRGLKRVHEEGSTRGIDARYADKLREMLTILEIASDVSEVNVMPGWRLHQLTGDLSGFWSLRVTGNQRLIFRFEDGGVPVKGPMHSPCHAGQFVRSLLSEELNLSVTEAADVLDVSRAQLSRLVNEKAALTWDMAIKLEKSFGLKADLMMRMQNTYDAAEARKRRDLITVNRVIAPQK